MKTIRFAAVVAQCGRPTVHVSWTTPKRDRALMTAVKQYRVMTVHQVLRGGKKDYGIVGVMQGGHVQSLIFPKSLRRHSGHRVIAIDYDLLATPRGREANEQVLPRKPAMVKTGPRPAESEEPRRESPVITLAEELPRPTWEEVMAELKRIRRALPARGASSAARERLAQLATRMSRPNRVSADS